MDSLRWMRRVLSAFRGTEFKGEVGLQASEKLALLAAASTDGYEKREVLKDTKLIQKTQEHQGQGVSYTDCKVEGRLRVDTPHLEATSTLGARPKGVEIAERDEFTEVVHTLENRVEEHSGPVTRSMKAGFKAALGVGVAAIGVATGGVGSGIAGTLATTALTSSAVSFVNHGLESVMNHESLDLKRILKDTGKSLAVAGACQVGGDLGVFGNLGRSVAVSSVVRGGSVGSHLSSQSLTSIAAEISTYIGVNHRQGLDGVAHKGLHGALALSSTLASQALKGGKLDWGQACVASGITVAGESAAYSLGSDFSPEDKQKLIAGLRAFSAASLVMQGAGPEHIHASDAALDNALSNNFALPLAIPAAAGLLEGAAWVGGAILAAWTGNEIVHAIEDHNQEKQRDEARKAEDKQNNGGGKGPRDPKGGPAIVGTALAASQARPKRTYMTRSQTKRAQDEKHRHNRELVRDKHAPEAENPGKTNLEKADHDRMRLRGQKKLEKVHPEFEKRNQELMENSGKKGYHYKKELPDGRKRFYKELTPSENPNNQFTNGGSTHVKEINPRTGQERNWRESYQKPSELRPKELRGEAAQNDLHTVQVHPKPINSDGTQRNVQHYPCAPKDFKEFEAGKLPPLNTKLNPLEKN